MGARAAATRAARIRLGDFTDINLADGDVGKMGFAKRRAYDARVPGVGWCISSIRASHCEKACVAGSEISESVFEKPKPFFFVSW